MTTFGRSTKSWSLWPHSCTNKTKNTLKEWSSVNYEECHLEQDSVTWQRLSPESRPSPPRRNVTKVHCCCWCDRSNRRPLPLLVFLKSLLSTFAKRNSDNLTTGRFFLEAHYCRNTSQVSERRQTFIFEKTKNAFFSGQLTILENKCHLFIF